jgi:hypothetical protein
VNPATPVPIDWATTIQICGGATLCILALAALIGLSTDRRKKK